MVWPCQSVSSIPRVMKEAFMQMQSGRPGPVAIEIPCDVLDASDDVEILEPATVTRPEPHPEQIYQAVQLISKAQHPVIWVGGGVIVSEASDELLQLAERIQAPVFTTILGEGAISDEHPLAAGSSILHPASCEYLAGNSVPDPIGTLNSNEFFAACDAMVAIGTRFTEEETNGWRLRLPESLIHIDIDPNEINRNYPATVGIVGDARQSLRQLNQLLESMPLQNSADRSMEVDKLKKRILQDCCQLAPKGVELVQRLRTALPRETIIVSDLTIAAYWCRRLLDLYQPRTYVYPWGFCTLGFGVPAAIGAKLAQPDQPVVLLSGDGGFLFNCQELAIAVQFGVPIVVLLFNDSAYGVLKPQQEKRYGRTNAVDLVNPDFMMLARAFGVDSQRVESIDQLDLTITKAIESNQTTIIEIPLQLPLPIMEPAPRLLHQSRNQ
ncbi:TPA: thiamine pyrophosphate-binding protein [Candidatus Poribacteria bacterium]|nr:thiamine pyrophosphate-binding protein [Candidatus Poribacteria bacterium]